MGIIDTLSSGFAHVGKNLWLMTVPVVLDTLLWVAPKLSVAPVVDRLRESMLSGMAALGSAGADASVAEMVQSLGDSLQASVGHTNVFSALTWGRLGVPGIAGLRQIQPATDRVLELHSYAQWLGAELGLLLVGLLIACAFLGMVAQTVRGEARNLGLVLRRVPTYWIRLLVLLVPLAFMLMAVSGSTVVFGALAFILWALMFWVIIYVSFVPQAITMSEQPALRAVAVSMAVVRQSFWPAFGLFVLVNLINLGLSAIWARVLVSNLGTMAAILLNAYVGTGLTTALFIYYRDRVAALRSAAQQ